MGCPAGLLWRLVHAVGGIHVSAASSTEPVARSELAGLCALRKRLRSPAAKAISAVLGNEVSHLDMYSFVIRFACFPPKTRVKVVSLTNPRFTLIGRIGLRGTHPSSRWPDHVVLSSEAKMSSSPSGLGPRGAKPVSEPVVVATQFLPEQIRVPKVRDRACESSDLCTPPQACLLR